MARRRPPPPSADADEQRLVDQLARAERLARQYTVSIDGGTDDMFGDQARWLRGRLEELRRRRARADHGA